MMGGLERALVKLCQIDESLAVLCGACGDTLCINLCILCIHDDQTINRGKLSVGLQ